MWGVMLQAVLKKALRNVDWSQYVQEEQQVVEGQITLKRKHRVHSIAPTTAPLPRWHTEVKQPRTVKIVGQSSPCMGPRPASASNFELSRGLM